MSTPQSDWIGTLLHSGRERAAMGALAVLGPVNYERLQFRRHVGYWPSLARPRTFNEKIAYRKLYQDMRYAIRLADKVAVRDFVAERIGPRYLNEVLLIVDRVDDIDFDGLPNQFVVKASHGSGWTLPISDWRGFERGQLTKVMNMWLTARYGRRSMELWYQGIPARLIVERFISEGNTKDIPIDYKFFCFDGSVQMVQIDTGKPISHNLTFTDRSFRPYNVTLGSHPFGGPQQAPPDFEQMVAAAETLAKGFDFVRVDMYNPAPGRVLVGELTFAPNAGWKPFHPRAFDVELGERWAL
jgi:hypothetical protein